MSATGENRHARYVAVGTYTLGFVAACVVLAFSLQIARVVHARFALPFDIDWIEGGQLEHARRILAGLPVYDAHDGFVAHPYPPLHVLSLALLGRAFGLDYATGRAFSAVCWLTLIALLAIVATRPMRNVPARVLLMVAVVGASARGYPFARGWFDLVRIDTFATLLAVSMALPLLREHISRRAMIVAGALGALSLFAKQTNVFIAVGALVALGVHARKVPRAAVAALVAFAIGGFVIGEAMTGGRFHVLLFQTGGHVIEMRRFVAGAWRVLQAAPLLAVVPVAWWFVRGRTSVSTSILSGMWLGCVPAALLPYAKVFGAENNLVPLLALSAALPVAFASDVLERAPRFRAFGAVAACSIVATLTYTLRFAPERYAPSATLLREVNELLEDTRALPGKWSVPVHPFLAAQLGNTSRQVPWLSYVDAIAAHRLALSDYAAALEREPPDFLVFANMPIEAPVHTVIARDYEHAFDIRGPAPDGVELFYSIPRMVFRRKPR